jgi:hypothetical protein
VEALFLLNELKQVIGDAWIGKSRFGWLQGQNDASFFGWT